MTWHSASGRYWDWPAVVRAARRRPGLWWLLESGAPAAVARTINERRAPALQLRGGRLAARVVNPHTVGGQERADIFIRFIPEGTE